MDLLFVVDSYFPFGTAISSRVVSFCRLFSDLGYNVHVIALFTDGDNEGGDTKYLFDKCSYQIVNSGKQSFLSYYFPDKKFIKHVLSCIKSDKYDCVVSLSCSLYYSKIRKETLKRSIPYYVEQCEWQDISNYKFGLFDYRYLRINFLRKKGYKSADGILSISSFLDSYYNGIGLKSVRVPTIMDVETIKENLSNAINDKIRVVYTGNPGKSKEYLKPIVQCFAFNDEIKERFEFHIYGPSVDDVINNLGSKELLENAGNSVVIHGKVPQNIISDVIANSHFQVFVRPNRRSSNAGFPTKLGESMAVGTPVITNDTGDICKYLFNGQNGFVLNGIEYKEVKRVFELVAKLTAEEYKQLRINARKTAETSFDYRNYYDKVMWLFNQS